MADVTDEASPNYLDPADRIATFDMDGTILCEKAPVYIKAAEYYSILKSQGWTPFSMAKDWKTIYGEGVQKTELPGTEESLADAA